MTQSLQTPSPAPEANARVRFLASVGPSATDRTVYAAGTEWTVSLTRAEALVDAGVAELLDVLEPTAPAPADATGATLDPLED